MINPIENGIEERIETAKGMTMLLVIIGNTIWKLQGVEWIYGISIPIVFLLNGYTFKKTPLNRKYINQAFSCLMTPYFITCAALLATDILRYFQSPIESTTGVIALDLLRSFFASGTDTNIGICEVSAGIGAIWFFPATFFAVLIVQIVFHNCGKRDSLAGFINAAFALVGHISGRFFWLPFSIQSGMIASFFVWSGYYIRKKEILARLRGFHYVMALGLLIIGISRGYGAVQLVNGEMKDIIISSMVSLSGCLIIYLVSNIDRSRFFSKLWKVSSIVLCAHLYILEYVTNPLFEMMNMQKISEPVSTYIIVALETVLTVLSATIISQLKPRCKRLAVFLMRKSEKKYNSLQVTTRDVTIDISKGLLIFSMILGHFVIDTRLSKIIFSCHMVAFVFLSGYYYRADRSIGVSIKRMVKTFLIPYGITAVADLILNYQNWSAVFFWEQMVRYLFGISYTKKLFADVPNVGPVYFILLLFLVRILYMMIDRCIHSHPVKWLAVLGITLFGVLLGKLDYWLPWSFDVACYCVVFYHLGYQFQRKRMLVSIIEDHFCYFVFSPVWVYMIYLGSMEIADRRYGIFGIVIVGAIMGTMMIIKLADYIARHMPVCRTILRSAGEATITILIIHTLLRKQIGAFVGHHFNPGFFPHLFISLVLQISFGLLIKKIFDYMRKILIKGVIL